MTSGDRYVLLGLARPRAAWFPDVSRWATAATIPAEFVKCVSAEELRARLASGRRFSAALLDASVPAVDRDLLASLRDAGVAPVVVDDRGDIERWRALGAAAVLPAPFDRQHLVEVLDAVATTVSRPSTAALDDLGDDGGERALVVAVCGAGGTGASTVAVAAAEGLARSGHDVVLADLARHAEQALLHDVRDVVPGIQELVEAHRSGVPSRDEVRRLTFEIVDRGYALLLGLRRARYWPSLRPRAFEASFDSLRRAFGVVVCDVTADLEAADDAGSADVEERNIAARTALVNADVVLVVGRAGVKGLHALVRVLADASGAGVAPQRLVPVVACAPRSPRARAELASAIGELAAPAVAGSVGPTLFLPARPVERAFRDGAPLPGPLPAKTAGAVLGAIATVGRREAVVAEPVPVVPGSLGSFSD